MDRFLPLLSVAYLLLLPCVTATSFWVAGVGKTVRINFPDDALFYNILARNMASGLGSTSDGLALSNGYHPLWMAVLSGLTALFGPSLEAEVVLNLLINCGILVLLYRLLTPLSNRTAALLACTIVSYAGAYFRVLWSGMETHLAWLGLVSALVLLQGMDGVLWSWRLRILMWVSLSVVFFSRLDGGLFWISLAAVLLFRAPLNGPASVRRAGTLLAIFSVPALLAIAYFVMNQTVFGSAMPVSGRIKVGAGGDGGGAQYFLGLLYRARWLWGLDSPVGDPVMTMRSLVYSETVALAFYAAIMVPVVVFALQSLVRRFGKDLAVRALLLYVLLHSFYYLFLQKDSYSLTWAKGPELLTLTVLLAHLADRLHLGGLPSVRSRIGGVLLFLLAFLGMAGSFRERYRQPDRITDYAIDSRVAQQAFDYVRTQIPEQAPVASMNIGFLGYYSGGRVVSYDGLLNSTTFYKDYLSKGRRNDYLREQGVEYVANRVPGGEDSVAYLCRVFGSLEPSRVKILKEFVPAPGTPEGMTSKYVVAQIDF